MGICACVYVWVKQLKLRTTTRQSSKQLFNVPFWISLRILLDPELPSWRHISSATHSIFCVVRTVRFRPLQTFREIEFVLSISRRRSLTELTTQFLLGNSLQMRLAPHPFCWQTSLIDALSSYVKWRYTVFPIVFPVESGSFYLFYLITKLLKIFARNLHMLLRIDYISTCVIHFKFTLLLKHIISQHVGRRFFMAHSVHVFFNLERHCFYGGINDSYNLKIKLVTKHINEISHCT